MNPEMVNSNIYLNSIFKISGIFGVETVFQFLIFLSALFFFILTFSLSLKIFTTYYTNWVVNLCNYNISKKLLDGYLNQPYIWFLNRHSADLSKTILSEIIAVKKKDIIDRIDKLKIILNINCQIKCEIFSDRTILIKKIK